ncbi:MAG: PD40 domain-containing protein [Chloroflexi bacterium]|nr:PD40 domain-containing protein [Chloroflexota bacterium]
MPNARYDGPHVLDNPPPFHQKLLDYGERPYWSPDGKRITFIETNYGEACELDLETRTVRNLTKGLGDHHSFLRVLFMYDGSYILIGPKAFKDRHTSRRVESEMWWMDREASRPPVPLGRTFFEGMGVSWIAPRITYAVNDLQEPSLGEGVSECYVSEVDTSDERQPRLVNTRRIYRVEDGRRPEPQDFRHDDREVLLAEYSAESTRKTPRWKCTVKGVDVATQAVRYYVNERGVHNECEGVFPGGESMCLESGVDSDADNPLPIDLWKLALDGSGRRARMTRMCDRKPWRATNSNVSPDGRWLAFMTNIQGDEAGYGRGLGLLDLAAWEASPEGQRWETAPVLDED